MRRNKNMALRSICLLSLISILTLLMIGAVPASPAAIGCSWQYTFGDDFNGTTLDTKKWNTNYPSGNGGELQYYAPDAFALKDGILRIKAEPRQMKGYDYTSGIITSIDSFNQQYGYFKMRAKAPKGKGFWPGFWLLPATPHYPWEVDVFEIHGDHPNIAYMTNHWQDATEGHLAVTNSFTGSDFSEDFHVFALEWDPTALVWSVDNVERYRTTKGVPNEPLFVLANLAVGGHWSGDPDQSTPFPSYLEIDYIQVYTRACQTNLFPQHDWGGPG